MTDQELIARLRTKHSSLVNQSFIMEEAADRIEELVKERDTWISNAKNAIWSDSEELKLTQAKLTKAMDTLREIEADSPSHGYIKYTLRTVLAELEGKE